MKKIIGLFIFAVTLLCTFSPNVFAEQKRQDIPPTVTKIDAVINFEVAANNVVMAAPINFEYSTLEVTSSNLCNLNINAFAELPYRIRLNKLLINKDRLDHGYFSYYKSKLLSTKKAVKLEPKNKRLC